MGDVSATQRAFAALGNRVQLGETLSAAPMLSRDGNTLYAAKHGRAGAEIMEFDVPSGLEKSMTRLPGVAVSSLQLSQDGLRAYSTSADGVSQFQVQSSDGGLGSARLIPVPELDLSKARSMEILADGRAFKIDAPPAGSDTSAIHFVSASNGKVLGRNLDPATLVVSPSANALIGIERGEKGTELVAECLSGRGEMWRRLDLPELSEVRLTPDNSGQAFSVLVEGRLQNGQLLSETYRSKSGEKESTSLQA